MPRIYKLSRAGLRLIYKVRHHRGHGIHSPFVYSLIRKVIEEKTPYYIYDDLKEYLSTVCQENFSINKYNKLSFRLVNYFNAKKVLEIGSGYGVNSLFLTAPSQCISCLCIETDSQKTAMAKNILKNWNRTVQLSDKEVLSELKDKQDCIFVNMDDCQSIVRDVVPLIASLCHEDSFVVVNGIRTNRSNYMLWKDISSIDGRTAMLDLFNIGIVFFNKELYRWNYQISF